MRRLARELASVHCEPTGCAWYHGLWPELRATGIAASAARQRELYERAFSHLDGELDAAPSVLVSGAADHAILAEVVSACAGTSMQPRVTVVDRCATPLRLCEAWADGESTAVETIASDVFELETDARFDVICSHSFIGLFAPARREELCERWTRLLRPGGAVIAVNRIRSADPDQPLSMSAASAGALCRELERRLTEEGAPPSVVATACVRAEVYVRNQRVFPLSEAELRARLEAAGLVIDGSWQMRSGDPDNAACEGIAVAANATHACVVARRK